MNDKQTLVNHNEHFICYNQLHLNTLCLSPVIIPHNLGAPGGIGWRGWRQN